MKKRIALLLIIIIILLITIFTVTNYRCLNRLKVAHGYSKDKGTTLTYIIASAFQAHGNGLQDYFLTKSAVEKVGEVNTPQYEISEKEIRKHNIILKGKLKKADGKNIIHIDQCIFLKDINSMYLFYHTYINNNIIHLSISDTNGSLITEAAFTDEKKGTVLRTSENYFWDIDYEKYNKLILTVKIYTNTGDFLYQYNQPLY